MAREKMVNYLEKRLQELARYNEGRKPKTAQDRLDAEFYRGEKRALEQTLKYVKSVKFNDDYVSKPRNR